MNWLKYINRYLQYFSGIMYRYRDSGSAPRVNVHSVQNGMGEMFEGDVQLAGTVTRDEV